LKHFPGKFLRDASLIEKLALHPTLFRAQTKQRVGTYSNLDNANSEMRFTEFNLTVARIQIVCAAPRAFLQPLFKYLASAFVAEHFHGFARCENVLRGISDSEENHEKQFAVFALVKHFYRGIKPLIYCEFFSLYLRCRKWKTKLFFQQKIARSLLYSGVKFR